MASILLISDFMVLRLILLYKVKFKLLPQRIYDIIIYTKHLTL